MWRFRRRRPEVDIRVVNNHVIVTDQAAAQDATVARLTVRADLILEELDGVVKQMAALLKEEQAP